MSKRNRIFLAVLLLFSLGVGRVLYTVASDLHTRYRESAEETLVDIAHILAALIEADPTTLANPKRLSHAFDRAYRRHFSARIYDSTKQRVELRLYVTDSNGIVLFDSLQQDTGKDFRAWNDINRTLSGQYGARTSRSDPDDPDTAIMYVAAPIFQDGQIAGAVSVGKPVASQQELVATAKQKLIPLGLATIFGFLFLLIALSIWLASPTRLLRDLRQILRQEKITRPDRILRRFRTVLKGAFFDMRDAMAGRSYTEEYIQALTHELKSPLTAIRGAAELLREPMPENQRVRFTDSINLQVQRLQDLADRLLELTHLEQRHSLDNPQTIRLASLIQEVLAGLEARAAHKHIRLSLTADTDLPVLGDPFLLHRAIANLVENALAFSPANAEIRLELTQTGETCRLSVRDCGPGIPDYALDRIFDKFYSLRRPDSGQKSTGLGLPFVREIAHLHGGEVALANHPKGGAVASLNFPL